MKLKPLLATLGVLLCMAGILLGLFLSGTIAWGESETGLYTSYHGDTGFSIQCPHMLAPRETTTVKATIVNFTIDDIKPVVSAEISHAPLPRHLDQIVPLAPKASKTVAWTVDSFDVIYYGRLIIVNVLQLRYSDNPSRIGSCGILLFSLFGLNGAETFNLIITLSLLLMAVGAVIWWLNAHRPLSEYSKNLVRISSTMTVTTLLALSSALPRWWGLTLICDTALLIMLGVFLSDFVIFANKYKH